MTGNQRRKRRLQREQVAITTTTRVVGEYAISREFLLNCKRASRTVYALSNCETGNRHTKHTRYLLPKGARVWYRLFDSREIEVKHVMDAIELDKKLGLRVEYPSGKQLAHSYAERVLVRTKRGKLRLMSRPAARKFVLSRAERYSYSLRDFIALCVAHGDERPVRGR